MGDADAEGDVAARGSSRLTAVPVRSTLDWLPLLVPLVSSTHANVQSAHTHIHTNISTVMEALTLPRLFN